MKALFRQLLQRVSSGFHAFDRLKRTRRSKASRQLEILKGKLVVGPEFFEPLDEEELKRWE